MEEYVENISIDYNYPGHKYNKIYIMIQYVYSENINQVLFSEDFMFLMDYCINMKMNDYIDCIGIKQICNFILSQAVNSMHIKCE